MRAVQREGHNSPRADGERRVTRRTVLSRSGQALGGGAALAASTGGAAASHAGTKPDHVTITEDTEWLTHYAPMLDLRHVPSENHPTLRGWRFTSRDDELDWDVGVYAAEYGVQDDVWTITSHAGDHEWVYVFVDPRTGEVDHVSYTAYHWLQGYVTSPNTNTEDGGEHPTLTVSPTYHNYIPSATTSESAVLLDVRSLGDPDSQTGPLYQWLDNGMETDLAEGAVHNPWNLSRTGALTDWWSREGMSRTNYWIVKVWALMGIRGADRADLGDRGSL